MTGNEYAAVAAFWAGYAAVAALSVWTALRSTRNAAPWIRRALASFLLAMFFAPSVIGGGHGGGIGPAWMALSQRFPIKLGMLPILVTFVMFFGIASAIAWTKRAKGAR